MLYSSRRWRIQREGGAIREALRSAWARLLHKQFLLLYPLALGVFNVLAFLAVYASLDGALRWSDYFRADFTPWSFLQDNADRLAKPGLPLIVGLIAGFGVCVATAAVRAPFFRAVTGPGYPLAPRGWADLWRLTGFYFAFYGLLTLLPLVLDWRGIGSLELWYWVAFVVQIPLVFADYVIVLEGVGPVRAVRRSVELVRLSPATVLGLFLAAWLLWQIFALVYGSYYNDTGAIFVLFPVSQLLVEALITTTFDVFAIFVYGRLAGR
jgi:hypothetical protein